MAGVSGSNHVTCELTCGCTHDYPRDLVKMGAVVHCAKCNTLTWVDRVHARRWHVSCLTCKFSKWGIERADVITAAGAHGRRTKGHHPEYVISFREVTRTGTVRAADGMKYSIAETTGTLPVDSPPPF